jgi:hypothetical protein
VAAAEFGLDGVARGGVEERRQLWRDAWEGHVAGGQRGSRKAGWRWKEVDWFAISEISGTLL